ncbi:MAG: carbohydrate-binding domain-containing protein, partial [Clostridia bacterium]|nr:carbohydrate-binding domain-containing protein [Clostridia bacterium]
LTALLCVMAASCGGGGDAKTTTVPSSTTAEDAETETVTATADTEPASSGNATSQLRETYFADGDFKDVSGETPNAQITLSGNTGTISDTTRGSSGSTVTVTSKGIYRVTGAGTDVTIEVADTAESGNVYLIFDGVTMANSSSPCVLVSNADKTVITCVGENTLSFDGGGEYDGAIYAKDDLTINGTGSLSITSGEHGVVCKNDLRITGAVLNVASGSIGLKANDSVCFGGGETTVAAGHDGVQVDSDDGDCYFYIDSGSLTVTAGYDGVDVGGSNDGFISLIYIVSGAVDISAGGGSSHSKSDTSQKGLRSEQIIVIDGGEVTISSADDSINSSDEIVVTGGELTLATSDDGIHADGHIAISGGSIDILKSYEGIEGYEVTITGGDISVFASDDGISCSGGSDTTSTETMPWMWSQGDSSAILSIKGGSIYVNAEGDGLDSNGSIYVSGGTTIVEGPSSPGNGAIDKGDGASCVCEITGGTVLAIGKSDMAVNFSSGTQCSALVSLSGAAGTEISVGDGSGFTYTATKSFDCIVYSSPFIESGSTCTISAGGASETADFSSSMFYSSVSSMGMGGPGGMMRP